VSSKDCVAVGLDQRAFNNMGGPLIQTWKGAKRAGRSR
jgi:hypothetical protein